MTCTARHCSCPLHSTAPFDVQLAAALEAGEGIDFTPVPALGHRSIPRNGDAVVPATPTGRVWERLAHHALESLRPPVEGRLGRHAVPASTGTIDLPAY